MRVTASRFIGVIGLAALSFTASAAPAFAQSLSGSFLAARHAVVENNFEQAAHFWRRALIRAPGDTRLMSQALFYSVLSGELEKALPIARQLETSAPDDRIANLTLAVDEIREGRFEAVRERLQVTSGDAVNSLMVRLLLAWAKAGEGDVDGALADFESLDNSAIYRVFGRMHAGHVAALNGRFDAAEAYMAEAFEAANTPSTRMVQARGAVLSQLDELEQARELFEAGAANDPGSAAMISGLEEFEAGRALALVVSSPQEGAADALFGLAGALSNEDSGRFGLLYARLSLHLAADYPEADLLIGDILLELDRFEAAADAYGRIGKDDSVYEQGQVGIASALRSMDRVEDAIEALRALAELKDENATPYFALAQVLSGEQRFAECVEAFDNGLARIGRMNERHWSIYYRRGICLERTGDWDRAEENFLMALELRPNEPDVLNYLGYSLIEQRRRLDEARGYLERAAAERPESGYIVDSLGWLFYRIGDYEAAAEKLEEAVRLDPVEPVILDHLGDALWKVGRRLEAEFQWKRSLSFNPTDEDRKRILRKLEVGLDQVLEDEARAADEGETPRQADVGAEDVAPAETDETPANGG
ncbi:MAG: tetratricopeptide repeat protein [Pseudomonadota bacterium]